MQKARFMDRRNGVTNLDSNLDRLGWLYRRFLRESLLDRLAIDPFHPETDDVPDALGAINRDDVGMPDARDEATFLDDGGRARIAGIRPGRQELQRNFAIEAGVPRAVDVSKRAAVNRLQDAKVTPRLRPAYRFVTGALVPMEVGQSRQHS